MKISNIFTLLIIICQFILLPLALKAQSPIVKSQTENTNHDFIRISHLLKPNELKFKALLIKKATGITDINYNPIEKGGDRVKIVTLPEAEFNVVCKILSESNALITEHRRPDAMDRNANNAFGNIEIMSSCENCNMKLLMQANSSSLNYVFTLISNITNNKYNLSNPARSNLSEYLLDMSFFLESLSRK